MGPDCCGSGLPGAGGGRGRLQGLGEQGRAALRADDGGSGAQRLLFFLTPLFFFLSLLLLCFLKGVGELVSASEYFILPPGLARDPPLLSIMTLQFMPLNSGVSE